MRTPPLAAVVFDLDGLIVNSEDIYEEADAEVLRRRGRTYEHVLRERMMGRPTDESLRMMIEHHGLSDTLEELRLERTGLRDRLLKVSLAPMPGFVELLSAISAAKIPAAIATSGTRDYAALVLARLGIVNAFRFVLTAEDVKCGKPAPDIYRLAAKRLELSPTQTIVLEDSANGCRAGIAAQAFTVAVPNRHTQSHDFTGVQFISDTLADRRIYRALGLGE